MGLSHALILSDLSVLTNPVIVGPQSLDGESVKLQFDAKLNEILAQNKLDPSKIHSLDNGDTLVIETGTSEQALSIKAAIEPLHRFIEYFEKLESSTIFIKYDQDELKYVYICDYCNTSLKNK
jgi:hypothetical protein